MCSVSQNLLILSQTLLSENFSLSFRFFERNFLSAPSPVARVWRSTLASLLTSHLMLLTFMVHSELDALERKKHPESIPN